MIINEKIRQDVSLINDQTERNKLQNLWVTGTMTSASKMDNFYPHIRQNLKDIVIYRRSGVGEIAYGWWKCGGVLNKNVAHPFPERPWFLFYHYFYFSVVTYYKEILNLNYSEMKRWKWLRKMPAMYTISQPVIFLGSRDTAARCHVIVLWRGNKFTW